MSEGMIYKAICNVMNEISHVGKDQKNQAQKFNYRGIDDIYNAMHRLMALHEVFSIPTVLSKSREERINKNGTTLAFTCLRIRYTFYCSDGSSVSCVVEGEGMDSGDKSSNKAMAVAHKYALIQTFAIPTVESDDPDQESHEVKVATVSSEQLEELITLVESTETDLVKFLKFLKVADLAELPASKFGRARGALMKKLETNNG